MRAGLSGSRRSGPRCCSTSRLTIAFRVRAVEELVDRGRQVRVSLRSRARVKTSRCSPCAGYQPVGSPRRRPGVEGSTMERLSPGDTAPDFTLADDTGAPVGRSRPARPLGGPVPLPRRDDARGARTRPATSPTPGGPSKAPGTDAGDHPRQARPKLAKFATGTD